LRRSDAAATEVIIISDHTTNARRPAGGANATIVRDFHDPRRVQSTPRSKNNDREGANDVWDREILNDKT
jgi:hypothetical protein